MVVSRPLPTAERTSMNTPGTRSRHVVFPGLGVFLPFSMPACNGIDEPGKHQPAHSY